MPPNEVGEWNQYQNETEEKLQQNDKNKMYVDPTLWAATELFASVKRMVTNSLCS